MTLNTKLIFALLFVLVFVNSSIISTYNVDEGSTNNGKESYKKKNLQIQIPKIDTKPKANKKVADPTQKGKIKYGLDMTFEDFKQKYGKQYQDDAQEAVRRTNFEKNKKNLEQLDCENCGVTYLFDLSKQELEGMNGFIPEDPPSQSLDTADATGARLLQTVPIPPRFDWRDEGKVSAVKYQGSCSVCWAFAATAFLESLAIIRGQFRNDIQLAEQYLVQCTIPDPKNRCLSSDPGVALKKGLSTGMPLQTTYPYIKKKNYIDGQNYCPNICRQPVIPKEAKFLQSDEVKIYSSQTRSDDRSIIQQLLKRPLIVGLNSQQYLNYSPTTENQQSKIFKCSKIMQRSNLNHVSLLVGYTEEYWIIKESVGTNWGLQGYVYVSRETNKNCGIGYYWATLKS